MEILTGPYGGYGPFEVCVALFVNGEAGIWVSDVVHTYKLWRCRLYPNQRGQWPPKRSTLFGPLSKLQQERRCPSQPVPQSTQTRASGNALHPSPPYSHQCLYFLRNGWARKPLHLDLRLYRKQLSPAQGENGLGQNLTLVACLRNRKQE